MASKSVAIKSPKHHNSSAAGPASPAHRAGANLPKNQVKRLPPPVDRTKVDARQLDAFVEEIARCRRGDEQQPPGKKQPSRPEKIQEEPQEDEEEGEEDDYSTVDEDDSDDDLDENLEEYAKLLLDYKESLDEEEEWIQQMEQRLMSEVADSLTTLKACQLAAEAQKAPPKASDEQRPRRCSAAQVMETRRASAAQIRAQSAKAEKKVKRAKARELKARKALVQALKKQHEQQLTKSKGRGQRRGSQWDEVRKSAQHEFDANVQELKRFITFYNRVGDGDDQNGAGANRF